MRVVYHSDFVSKDLNERATYFAVPSSSYIEIIADKTEKITETSINGSAVTNLKRVECPESAKLVVVVDGAIKTFEVKPIAKLLPPVFSGVYREFDYDLRKMQESTLDSVLNGVLKMYAVEQSAEVKDISEILKNIRYTFPAIKRVCDKPKSHLKAINEVKQIETVKRVGYESIPYLAAHSEDWLAKTASGLKPARLFSRVEDEDFHIYENRFVKTVIDEIITFLKINRDNLKDQVSQIKGILDSSVQTSAFGFDAGFARAVTELIQEDSDGAVYRSKQMKLAEELLKEATALWKKYRILRNSRLYRFLKRAKSITNPVNETNILLMDKHYRMIFKFWKVYPKLNAPREIDKVNPDNLSGLQENYKLFCETLCQYTAHTMGFEQESDGKFIRHQDNVRLDIKSQKGILFVEITDATMRELNVEQGLVCPIQNGVQRKKFKFNGHTLYWENDITENDIDEFCGLLKTRGSRGREQEDEKKHYLALKQALIEKNRRYGTVKLGKMILLTPFVNIENETQNIFLEYMKGVTKELEADYIVVAMPKCNIPEQRLTVYAKQYGEKTAFLPLTMFDINSYRRLQNIFLRLIIKLGKTKCPICGSTLLDRECTNKDCGLVVTKTQCGNQKCKHEYTYCYNGRQENSADSIATINPNDFYQYDSRFQYRDITSLSVDGKIKPICPKCGT